jgi:hypothetical protein
MSERGAWELRHRKRWGIKQSYHTLKNKLKFESVTGKAKEYLRVNYLAYEIWNVEKEKNTWITNKPITENTVSEIAKCGRSRWKIENEHNNVLKHRGYNLEHNFGHGDKRAAEFSEPV